MQPEKIDLTSASVSEEKLAQLRDMLPEVFHEGTINWDELRNALGGYVEDDPKNERFGLRWPGKSQLQQVINTPSVGTLVPMPEESVGWDTTGNVIIEGDNLEVLKLLQKSYAGKVKMIYIDPPYNTGNDFVYPDKYASGIDTYLEFTGQKDDAGNRLTSNSESNGRYHANWLNMMYPRLYLARNLLQEDGLIFVSIDDSEVDNLKKLLNEIFGEEGFVNTIIWHYGKMSNERNKLPNNHEYVLVYKKSQRGGIFEKVKKEDSEYRNRYLRYVTTENTVIYGSVKKSTDGLVLGRVKKIKESLGKGHLDDDDVLFDFNEEFKSHSDTIYVSNIKGNAEENVKDFDTGQKPLALMDILLRFGAAEKNSLVLDFFAGSGTTGHAVMQRNAEDGGSRKHILVQLPEPTDEGTPDNGEQPRTIADICRERLRRAGKRITAVQRDNQIDTGFRSYRLASSNFKPWHGSNDALLTSARRTSFMPQTNQLTLEDRLLQTADHLDPNASDVAVLTELLLKLGEELTVPVKVLNLAGKTVFDIDSNLRLMCLERSINLHVIREMAALEPAEIICLDASFPDDQTKVNAAQIIATQASRGEESIAFKVV